MKARVREFIQATIESEGVEELFRVGGITDAEDIFSNEHLSKMRAVNLTHGTDFSDKLKARLSRYNDCTEHNTLKSKF